MGPRNGVRANLAQGLQGKDSSALCTCVHGCVTSGVHGLDGQPVSRATRRCPCNRPAQRASTRSHLARPTGPGEHPCWPDAGPRRCGRRGRRPRATPKASTAGCLHSSVRSCPMATETNQSLRSQQHLQKGCLPTKSRRSSASSNGDKAPRCSPSVDPRPGKTGGELDKTPS